MVPQCLKLELKLEVVKARVELDRARVVPTVAPPEEVDRVRRRHLVAVAHDDQVVVPRAGQPAHERVALEVLELPGIRAVGQVLDDDMLNERQEARHRGVRLGLLKDERLRLVRVRARGLRQDEAVHDGRERVQPQPQHVELVEEGEGVPHAPRLRARAPAHGRARVVFGDVLHAEAGAPARILQLRLAALGEDHGVRVVEELGAVHVARRRRRRRALRAGALRRLLTGCGGVQQPARRCRRQRRQRRQPRPMPAHRHRAADSQLPFRPRAALHQACWDTSRRVEEGGGGAGRICLAPHAPHRDGPRPLPHHLRHSRGR